VLGADIEVEDDERVGEMEAAEAAAELEAEVNSRGR